jgi:hypothetical protein
MCLSSIRTTVTSEREDALYLPWCYPCGTVELSILRTILGAVCCQFPSRKSTVLACYDFARLNEQFEWQLHYDQIKLESGGSIILILTKLGSFPS